jgi:hypothetical protein
MGVAKEPYRGSGLKALDDKASELYNHPKGTEKETWYYKLYLVLRFTGMHSSCIYRPESNIREVNINGITHIVWSRPMKGAEKGKKNYWREVAGVPKARTITFDVRDFYLQNLKSKRSYSTWKSLIHYKIHKLGINAGFTDVSPNTLRHSFLMEMLEVYDFPKLDVSKMAGCSQNTLDKHYNSLGATDRARKLKEKGW